jgi:N-acetylmuramoyl-L-alanine amidase
MMFCGSWIRKLAGTLALAGACSMVISAGAVTVVLDTGHTPKRPGSTSATGKPEYGYNLALSNRVAAALEAAGITVLRIGADGQEVALGARTAGTGSAALFVSIHHDSIQQSWIDEGRAPEYAGFSVFVSGKNPRPNQSLACARMVGDALVRSGEKPSLYHATPIKGENRPLLDEARGVHRFDDLVVLKSASSPALLIEAGVIVNPKEAVRLAQAQTIDVLGRQISAAITACLGSAQDGGRK